MQRVDAEAMRLTDLGAAQTVIMSADGLDHHAEGMRGPLPAALMLRHAEDERHHD